MMRWGAVVVLLVTGCAAGPVAPVASLSLEVDPGEVLFNQRVTVTVHAKAANGQPGSGTVELVTPVGRFDATTLELDASGQASTSYACATVLSCVGRALLEATWRDDGRVVQGSATVELVAAGPETLVVTSCVGPARPGLEVTCCSAVTMQPRCPAVVVPAGSSVLIPFVSDDGTAAAEVVVRWVAPSQVASSVACEAAGLELVMLESGAPVSLDYGCANHLVASTGEWGLSHAGGCQPPAKTFVTTWLCEDLFGFANDAAGVVHSMSRASFNRGTQRFHQADDAMYLFVLRRGG
jgi:hypothetical protein